MNIQPVLTGGKGVATDLSLVASYSTNSLLVFMDTALLERVPASPECLQYKLLGRRMVNMGVRRCPAWLDRQAVLSGWGTTVTEKRKNYRHAVESSLLVDITDLSEQAAAEAVLGSEAFIDRMRRAMNDVKENVNVRRESTQQRRLRSWRSLDEVIRAFESGSLPSRALRGATWCPGGANACGRR